MWVNVSHSIQFCLGALLVLLLVSPARAVETTTSDHGTAPPAASSSSDGATPEPATPATSETPAAESTTDSAPPRVAQPSPSGGADPQETARIIAELRAELSSARALLKELGVQPDGAQPAERPTVPAPSTGSVQPALPSASPESPKPQLKKPRNGPVAVVPTLAPHQPKAISEYGPISVGHPHEGYLVNGMEMPKGPHWSITAPQHRWGTEETIDALIHCIERVNEKFPQGTPPAMLGSLSAKNGGLVPPHKSHRTGRDVDFYFYRTPGAKWYQAAKESDIDYPRTWAALRCVVTETDVDYVLIDQRRKDWIEAYALSQGEDPAWIRDLFHDRSVYHRALIKHVPGHVAHMHVRYVSPKARQCGRKLYDRLIAEGVVKAPEERVSHKVVEGDTLSVLAARYKTEPEALRQLNRLETDTIKVGQELVIRRRRDLRDAREPIYVPPRRLPPNPAPAVRSREHGPVASVSAPSGRS